MGKLSPDQLQLFSDKNFVAVATVGKDGTPRNTIVWVDVDGDDVLMNGGEKHIDKPVAGAIVLAPAVSGVVRPRTPDSRSASL